MLRVFSGSFFQYSSGIGEKFIWKELIALFDVFDKDEVKEEYGSIISQVASS